MKYKLKPGVESFEVVDGAFAGKKYFRGKVYEKIPPEEAKKFEEIGGQRSEVGGEKKTKKKIPQTSSEAALKPDAAEGETGGDK